MTPQEWLAAGELHKIGDRRLFVRVSGEGAPLLLIHGFPTSSWDWHRIWNDLAAEYTVIAPDMLGFGFSDKPRGHAYSLFEQTDLVEQIVLQYGHDTVHVLSHDYGDTVAQELLARHAAGNAKLHIQSVCMLNGGVIPGQHRPRPMQRLLCSPLGFLVSWLLNERKFHKSFAEVFGAETQPTVQELHDFWTCIVHNDGPAVVHRISRYQQERRRNYERWVGALRDTSVPFLGIFGETDPVSGVHMAEAIARLRSPDEMVRLPHIGHYPQTEAPGAVLEAYRGFRQRLQ